MSVHLVTGAGGQDGVLLSRLLVAGGHHVVVATLTGDVPVPGAEAVRLDVRDTDDYLRLIEEHRPVACHHLAAVSSVGASWKDPEATRAVNQVAVEALLARLTPAGPRFVHASSSEIFGPVAAGVAAADTPLAPVNPYGESKAAAHRAVQRARSAGLPATNLILFGHTSELHDERFVLPTLVRQAVEVARGERPCVELRDPSIARDWGSAHEVVRAFAAAVEAPPGDYVVATGELHRLSEIASWALAAAGAPPDAVSGEVRRERPHDYGGVRGDITETTRVLGWRPERTLRQEIESMVRHRLRQPGG